MSVCNDSRCVRQQPFSENREKVLITGGAGFIGCNAASRFLRRGGEVIILDNLSGRGARENVEWLRRQGRLVAVEVDMRDADRIKRILEEHRDVTLILHFAGQVSVTGSISDPRTDFEVNTLGTLNALEAVRRAKISAPVIYSSTNKVYGRMPDIPVELNDTRYLYLNHTLGISEDHPLDFHSPYGCSKGAADQYVRDYHRIYGLNTVVFRQSCIYGLRQFGVEEHGWVAWFVIAAVLGKSITLFGDGKQVRDVLFVDDLLDAYELAAANIESVAGSVFNIGGGLENSVSLLELLHYLEFCRGHPIRLRWAEWRPGDQRIYVSDIRRAAQRLGWKPQIGWQQGIDCLSEWVTANRHLFR
jgi:CDP-paratose 2-epimerase